MNSNDLDPYLPCGCYWRGHTTTCIAAGRTPLEVAQETVNRLKRGRAMDRRYVEGYDMGRYDAANNVERERFADPTTPYAHGYEAGYAQGKAR